MIKKFQSTKKDTWKINDKKYQGEDHINPEQKDDMQANNHEGPGSRRT